jgi:hypothetical protein
MVRSIAQMTELRHKVAYALYTVDKSQHEKSRLSGGLETSTGVWLDTPAIHVNGFFQPGIAQRYEVEKGAGP